ncbi:hypothetical protein HHI36_010814 [Cryptolaemus montrouzieri]|uniref:Uncharacterized protein n=1 Tax=Cryptolaemus montrouzieri TaxID=559131 RepID=A0ABD2MKJ9_9CUCU
MIIEEEKMQVEELKEAQTFLNIESKMTCTDTNEVSSMDQNAEPTSKPSNGEMEDTKFEGINLEDDIEKVELSSPDYTDSSEDDSPHDFSELPDECQFLNGHPRIANEELRNWLVKIKDMQTTIYKKMQLEQQSNANSLLTAPSKNFNSINTPPNPNRVMKYQDLPYMGEITLDNSKPRRGRKPKKADICHLIYKNYGTILPGTPNAIDYIEQSKKSTVEKEAPGKNNVQNRIISSLLEKRLTQQENRKPKSSKKLENLKKTSTEPMNLCVRDLDQLKIKLTKNSDDTYSTIVKPEPQSDNESENIHDNSLNDEYGVPQFLLKNSPLNSELCQSPVDNSNTPPFGFWPDGLVNTMALHEQLMYYQRLAAMTNSSIHSSRPPPDIIPISSKPKETRKLAAKIKPKENKVSDDSEGNTHERIKRTHSGISEKSPTKRKRSAIFIPPIPTENNTNPATEVSICKFKFTGGAKPSLQEKKMLSVDSGGNFRYYSGTGDKSMRGYEFFPRETLQQTASATQGSSTGAFLQASGEKFFPVNELNEKQVKSEFLLSPELPSTSTCTTQDLNSRHKKRKSRKSLQREKLEQTFKEKGFLIQTQQLESAEGATYCKFRQLRKFTRYLFRSWKDYLPGNVQEIQEPSRNEHSIDNFPNVDMT